MRQNDDEEKEKKIVVDFAKHVLFGADAFGFSAGDLLTNLVHIIGCTLPVDLDEELLRDLLRMFHQQIHGLLDERKKYESVQDMQDRI